MRLKLAAWGSAAATVAVALLLVAGASASGVPAVNLDQCANGSDASSNCPPNWQNGDLNPNNSLYTEGDSVPFRLKLSGLSAGDHTVVIQFDTTKSGKHAYDYLTRFDRTVTGADPCGDGWCSGSPSTSGTIPLPTDPAPPSSLADSERYISIWGGSISDVTLGGDPSDVAGQDQSMTIHFSTDADTVVLAWGGHVADEATWGPNSGAGSIPGSPYHMRVISLDDGSIGNQDRQMKTLDTPSIQTDPVADEESQTVTDNALLTGNGKNAVAGTVDFFLCYAAIGTPDCSSGGTPAGTDIEVSDLGTASSDPVTASHGGGTYCFRAEFTPAKNAKYTSASETNQTINNGDGNHGECFTVEGPPQTQLTLHKNVSGGTAAPSDFTLTAIAGQETHTGSGPSAGPFDVTPGTSYTLGESGPSGYTAGAWSCDGGSLDGSAVTLQAGDHVTCTITNTAVVVTTTTTTTPPPAAPPAPPTPPSIDLAITKSVAPTTVTTGSNATWTETVTNNGPDTATGVTVADALPAGVSFVSVTASQGTCTGTAFISCAIGSLAKGASATITIVTTATTAGSIVNTATVVGNEADTNTANNTASATLTVTAPFTPPPPVVKPPKKPVVCTAVVAAPHSIYVGRNQKLTLKILQSGKGVRGIHVRIAGPSLTVVTKASNGKGIVTVRLNPKRPGIVRLVPVAHKQCRASRVGAVGVFTPPVTG